MLTSLLVATLIGCCASNFLPSEEHQANVIRSEEHEVVGNRSEERQEEPVIRKPTIVDRADWGARLPKGSQVMANPVGYVVIHHTYRPEACTTDAACASCVRGVQNYHMDTRGWLDIGYSFLVGGDNRTYEGRGWSKVGAHAIRYNRNSIGIAAIGDWQADLPPEEQLQVIKELIAYGVELGKISPEYKLIGHRQASDTTCPGTRLYREIQTWPNWYDTL